MLADAYNAAERGDHAPLHELLALFRQPFAEQPAMAPRYYRRAPDSAAAQGGIGFMS
jgi:hypothetical protein